MKQGGHVFSFSIKMQKFDAETVSFAPNFCQVQQEEVTRA